MSEYSRVPFAWWLAHPRAQQTGLQPEPQNRPQSEQAESQLPPFDPQLQEREGQMGEAWIQSQTRWERALMCSWPQTSAAAHWSEQLWLGTQGESCGGLGWTPAVPSAHIGPIRPKPKGTRQPREKTVQEPLQGPPWSPTLAGSCQRPKEWNARENRGQERMGPPLKRWGAPPAPWDSQRTKGKCGHV